MSSGDYGQFFKFIRAIVRLRVPRYRILDEPEQKAVVYVSHHQNLLGPVQILCWYPQFLRTWIYHVFLDRKESYRQYVDYTFTRRFGWPKFLARILAWPAALFAEKLTVSGRGIPVYRQSRKVVETMRASAAALRKGESLLIFPDVSYDSTAAEVDAIYEGFLSIEKYYYRRTGEHVDFVPLYADKNTHEIRKGTSVRFEGQAPFGQEKKCLARRLQQELNRLAGSKERGPADPSLQM